MSEHQSVNDYITAWQTGDDNTCKRVTAEAVARYKTSPDGGTELVELGRAMETAAFTNRKD